ncbi:MAG: hypothetical protein AMXMBFR84_08400 [Candidatus Hydrogenedentota bacterium]
MNRILLALLGIVSLTTAMSAAWAQDPPADTVPAEVTARGEWDPETLRLLALIPVQEGGRLKPLDSYASFLMLRLNGKRSMEDLDGRKMTPIEWMGDCLFYPELARHYKVFRIDDTAVLDAIGVEHNEDKRAWFSYGELEPGLEKLMTLGDSYNAIEAKDREPLQRQIVNLAFNVREFEQVIHFFDFAKEPLPIPQGSALGVLIPDSRYSTAIEKARSLATIAIVLENGFPAIEKNFPPDQVAQLQETVPAEIRSLDDATRAKELETMKAVFHEIDRRSSSARFLAILPPPASMTDQKEWFAPADILEMVLESKGDMTTTIRLLSELEDLFQVRQDPAQLKQKLAAYQTDVAALADARGEYNKIPMEVAFYKFPFKPLSLAGYILCFILAALCWFWPKNRVLRWTTLGMLLLPTGILIAGITWRCILRSRPPVSTLYETILFITAVAVVVAIFIEFVNKQRIAQAMAAFLGMLGMFLAYRYEIKEGVDTMPALIAVLDTNFWLATHVTTVTMGYAAGLLAGGMAHIYILGRLFGVKRNDTSFYKTVTRMTYGIVCFGLLFSVVGTILGGIWANDSWGRFWGWDPKENGALLIVLCFLAVLHARMGGLIRDLGLAMTSVFTGMVVAFSWWGVNLLGVGLHSYGFTDGVIGTLMLFYITETVVIGLGGIVWLKERYAAPAAAAETAPKGKIKPAKADSARR